MDARRMLLGILAATVAAPVPGPVAGPLAPQDLDAARWRALVQMPVAVARLELAGISPADLERMIPPLDTSEVAPADFLEAARGIPILWGADYDPQDDYDTLPSDTTADAGASGDAGGAFVQELVGRGLKGAPLAGAILDELQRRGIPRLPGDGRTLAPTLHPDFIPDDLVDGRFRDDPFFRRIARAADSLGEDPGAGDPASPRLFGAPGSEPSDSASPLGGEGSVPAVRRDTSGGGSRPADRPVTRPPGKEPEGPA